MKHTLLLVALVPTIVAPAQHAYCPKPQHFLSSGSSITKQIKCLATTVYGESRGESVKGQIAVAYTALNRAKNTTICDVVLAYKQYSIYNDNPTLRAVATHHSAEPIQKNNMDALGWKRALSVAELVLLKAVPDPTKGATHYLSDKGMKFGKYRYPKWSKKYKQVAVIGNHKFYKMPNKVVDRQVVVS